jgi:hypothetical protein
MWMQNRVCCCLWGLLAAFFVSGCGPNSDSLPLHLAVRTVEDTVMLQRVSDATFFNVTAIARNDDSRPLRVELCTVEAQRDIDGTWTTVFTPACLSSGGAPLASGDSVVVPVNVFGSTVPNIYPLLDPRMVPGRYRLLFGVGLGDVLGPTGSSVGQVQASTPFTVK